MVDDGVIFEADPMNVVPYSNAVMTISHTRCVLPRCRQSELDQSHLAWQLTNPAGQDFV